jgi:SAM (Sterile alpha motif) domain-containing protein
MVEMDVAEWLRALGLEQYARVFRQNEIDQEVLPELTDADLEKLGVPMGHRKRLLRAILTLRAAAPVAASPPAGQPQVDTSAERRQLTVMFCDLVGSTALSARLDPTKRSIGCGQIRATGGSGAWKRSPPRTVSTSQSWRQPRRLRASRRRRGGVGPGAAANKGGLCPSLCCVYRGGAGEP